MVDDGGSVAAAAASRLRLKNGVVDNVHGRWQRVVMPIIKPRTSDMRCGFGMEKNICQCQDASMACVKLLGSMPERNIRKHSRKKRIAERYNSE